MASDSNQTLDAWAEQSDYKWGFVTDIESETLPPGLDEGVVRAISARKQEPEWLLEWRLKAYRHWLTMKEPEWAHAQGEVGQRRFNILHQVRSCHSWKLMAHHCESLS